MNSQKKYPQRRNFEENPNILESNLPIAGGEIDLYLSE